MTFFRLSITWLFHIQISKSLEYIYCSKFSFSFQWFNSNAARYFTALLVFVLWVHPVWGAKCIIIRFVMQSRDWHIRNGGFRLVRLAHLTSLFRHGQIFLVCHSFSSRVWRLMVQLNWISGSRPRWAHFAYTRNI